MAVVTKLAEGIAQRAFKKSFRESMEQLLVDITNGEYDEYLEAILAAAHSRKRDKRGVRNSRGMPRA